MLTLQVAVGDEEFDEETQTFGHSSYVSLNFEHSLASLSKWEENYEKPFLGENKHTEEESFFYLKDCMLIGEKPREEIWGNLSVEHFNSIQKYINAKKSATWFNENQSKLPGGKVKQIITSELVYGWLVALRIPFEVQYWHINRLFTLIRVCNEQNKKPKKMSKRDALSQQHAMNAQRRAQLGTRG